MIPDRLLGICPLALCMRGANTDLAQRAEAGIDAVDMFVADGELAHEARPVVDRIANFG